MRRRQGFLFIVCGHIVEWSRVQYTFHFHHCSQKLVIRQLRVLKNFLETTVNMRSKKPPLHGANSKLNRHLILWFKEKLWTSGNSKRNDKNLAAVFKVLGVFWHDHLWYTSSADETCKACNECFRAQVWYNIKMNGSATSTSVKHDVEFLHTVISTNNGPVLVKAGFSSTRNWGRGAVGGIA